LHDGAVGGIHDFINKNIDNIEDEYCHGKNVDIKKTDAVTKTDAGTSSDATKDDNEGEFGGKHREDFNPAVIAGPAALLGLIGVACHFFGKKKANNSGQPQSTANQA